MGLVSLGGALAWSEHVPVASHRGPEGAATQDAEQWWQLICSAAQTGGGRRGGACLADRGGLLHRSMGEHRSGRRRWPSRR